ncbi:MAG: hypothetical protein IT384_22135 [Deltaproteobacteria bacterium]|nr:hypothetical protein [Deltaproteobacteria bacterium]
MEASDPREAALEALWQRVLEAPEDEERHQKFVSFAVESDLFLSAIERYKALAKEGGALAVRAEGFQKRIAAQAAAKVLSRSGGPRPPSRLSAKVANVLVAVGMLTMVLGYRHQTAILVGAMLTGIGTMGTLLLGRRRA